MSATPHPDRRRFLTRSVQAAAGIGLLPTKSDAADTGIVASVEKVVLRDAAKEGTTWFHPRACRIPGAVGPEVFMTLQSIGGSDYFGPVQWTTTRDLGKTWSAFQAAPPLGWEKLPDGSSEAVCDVTPEWHAKTGSVLALGHNVFYKTAAFHKEQPARCPVYAVWKDGAWGPRKKLRWDDPRGSYIYSNNCGQRVNLPDGKVMMSFTFGVKDQPRAVCGVRCTFDGEELVVRETGPALTNAKGRGLLEPSITHFKDRFYLTIRAEDGRGYVTSSDDGLHYAPQQAWAFDDGEVLGMSTTQQHWLTHSDALFLVYTRRDASNDKVMRWRAPLWMAQVDPESLRLIRSTERVVLPLVGDGVKAPEQVLIMGNFGIVNASAAESWVTVGSWCPKDLKRGELQFAHITWSRPNALVTV